MDLYFQKKNQMQSNNQKPQVADVKVEIEKKRTASPSPAPAPRTDPSLPAKKIVYHHDLVDLKNKLDALTTDVNKKHDEMKTNLDNLSKSIDSSKVENLKTALNDSVKQMNTNIQSISGELVSHLDSINTLTSKVGTIESML